MDDYIKYKSGLQKEKFDSYSTKYTIISRKILLTIIYSYSFKLTNSLSILLNQIKRILKANKITQRRI